MLTETNKITPILKALLQGKEIISHDENGEPYVKHRLDNGVLKIKTVINPQVDANREWDDANIFHFTNFGHYKIVDSSDQIQ